MDKLPNEILHQIFISVPFKERVECLLVCRYWYSALFNRSLLYDVIIYDSFKFKYFVDIIRHMPGRGAQVEILVINFLPNSRFRYQGLCNRLPNLRKIQLRNLTWEESEKIFWNEPFELQIIDSKLEEIKDSSNCELTRQLIQSNSCTRLTSLELKLSLIESLEKEFFVYLKNTPVLKDIVLSCHGIIGIKDCEMLHKNVPALETFCLKGFKVYAGELPHDITPATSVKRFSMRGDHVMDFDTYPNWYKYLAKKYTNLIDFDYEDQNIIDTVNSDATMTIYRDGLIPIYKNMRNQQQKTFNAFNILTELDIFNQLGEFGVRFKTFNFTNNKDRPIFTQLAESNLSMYAKHITLISTTIPSPILLQNFTSLRTLGINMHQIDRSWDANLTDYLNAIPPTLTSFTAYFANVEIGEFPARPNNIEEFCFYCDTITPKMGEIISNHFPNLNSLDIQGHVTENLNLNLPNNHFKKLFINTYFEDGLPHGFLITNTESLQYQYFIGENRMDEGDIILVPATAEDLQDRVNINIRYVTADRTRYYTSYMPRRRGL